LFVFSGLSFCGSRGLQRCAVWSSRIADDLSRALASDAERRTNVSERGALLTH
jgi:hypothetical protein